MIKYAQKDSDVKKLRVLYDLLVKGEPTLGLNILKNMYYDTAYTSGSAALGALKEFAGASQIVFGTDFPFFKPAAIVAKTLSKHPSYSDKDFEKIYHQNCLELFSQFK